MFKLILNKHFKMTNVLHVKLKVKEALIKYGQWNYINDIYSVNLFKVMYYIYFNEIFKLKGITKSK